MLLVEWSKNDGWAVPKIVPYGDLSLSPACSALHYGTEVSVRVLCLCLCLCVCGKLLRRHNDNTSPSPSPTASLWLSISLFWLLSYPPSLSLPLIPTSPPFFLTTPSFLSFSSLIIPSIPLTQCFEGLKAYKRVDGKIRLFRPMENMKRFNRSAIASSVPVSMFACYMKHVYILYLSGSLH